MRRAAAARATRTAGVRARGRRTTFPWESAWVPAPRRSLPACAGRRVVRCAPLTRTGACAPHRKSKGIPIISRPRFTADLSSPPQPNRRTCWSPRPKFPARLDFVAVIPEVPLPTEKARAVLPAHYSRSVVVHNLQRTALLAAAFFSGGDSRRNCSATGCTNPIAARWFRASPNAWRSAIGAWLGFS